jgi:uncharacterized lipoprotein YmbA
MPGQCLTLPQAARLFAIPLDVCARVFSVLARDGVVQQTSDGRYTCSGFAR